MVSNRFSTLRSKGLSVVNAALASFYFLSTIGCSSPTESGCILHLAGPRPSEPISILSYDENGHASQIDSILPSDSVHVIQCNENQLLILSINGSPLYFIAEKGAVTIDFKDGTVHGTPLNDAKLQFEATYNKLLSSASAKYDSIAAISGLSLDDKNAELAQLSNRETKRITDYVMSQVLNNKDNAFGQFAFLFGIAKNSLVGAEDYDKFLAKAGPNVSEFPPVHSATTILHNGVATSVGCNIKDVSVVKSDGVPSQLTSLIDTGAINVIHVFNPYNNSTPQTLHLISRIKNEVKRLERQANNNSNVVPTNTVSHHINFISVVEYVDEDIVKKITQRFNLDWTMVADSNALFVQEYGITSLPYFFIVDGNRKIEERGVGEDALFNWVYSKIFVK